jgi:hypothetical protein
MSEVDSPLLFTPQGKMLTPTKFGQCFGDVAQGAFGPRQGLVILMLSGPNQGSSGVHGIVYINSMLRIRCVGRFTVSLPEMSVATGAKKG